MARPTKYTPETVKAITDAIKLGLSNVDACAIAGISADTYTNWKDRYSAFSDAITKAHAEAKENRLKRILAAGMRVEDGKLKGSWQADAWFLERRYPDEFSQQMTLKLPPEWMATLKANGLTPMEAMRQLINEMQNEPAER
jgi:hypothetical protein